MDVYLDNSATTMPYEEVTRKVTEMMTSFWGNPSALYAGGIKAEREIRRLGDRVHSDPPGIKKAPPKEGRVV